MASVVPAALANGSFDRLSTQVRDFLVPQLDTMDSVPAEALDSFDDKAEWVLQKLGPDGFFSDIDTSTIDVWARDVQAHSERLLVLARAYHLPGQDAYQSGDVLDGFVSAAEALESLLSPGMDRPGNWWNWEIGLPKAYGPALFLMKDELDPAFLGEAVDTLRYLIKEEPSPWSRTGQNLVWVSFTRLYLGLLTEDTDLLDTVAGNIDSVCVITTGEGIQPDGSFHQHGPSLQTGSYGAGLAADIGIYARMARGTPWELDPDAAEAWLFLLTHGSRWSIYRNFYEPSSRGRGIVRPDSTGHDAALHALLLGAFLETAADTPLASSARHTLATWTRSMDPSFAQLAAEVDDSGVQAGGPVGFNLYPRSDYAINRDDNWFLSLKMLSSRTLAAERYNDEGKQSRHLSSGVTWLMKSGDEWDRNGVRATLDWARLPGTTTEIGLDLSKGYPNNQCYGLRDFVGGLEAGNGHGLAVMDWEAREHNNDSGLRARKSWFFWPGGMVAIGSEIHGWSGLPVETTARQWPLSTADAPIRINGTPAAENEWEEALAGPAWITADGIGTWIPQGEWVRVARKEQTGRFIEIHRDGTTVHRNTFLNIGFEHGIDPNGEDYAYAIMPDIAEPPESMPFEIIQRGNGVHAVRFPENGRLAAVFWDVGVAGHLACNQRIAVATHRVDDQTLELRVANPAQSGGGYVRIFLAAEVTAVEPAGVAELEQVAADGVPVSVLNVFLEDGETTTLTLGVRNLRDFDEQPPVLFNSGSSLHQPGAVEVRFSRSVDAETGGNPDNYAVFPFARIDSVALSEDGLSAAFEITGQVSGQSYRLYAHGLRARADHQAQTPLSWIRISGAMSPLTMLAAGEDTYVRDGSHADQSFGSETGLAVKNDGSGYHRETYLQFDLSDVTEPVHRARLLLYVNSIGPIQDMEHEILTTDSDWTEDSLTWNTRPWKRDWITSYSLNSGSHGFALDITPAVNARLGGILSLCIRSAANVGPDGWMTYDSSESTNGRPPALAISQTIPMTSWLQALLPPESALPDADPDRDGFPNILEYALGLDPASPDTFPLAFDTLDDGNHAVFISVPEWPMAGTELVVEVSRNLATWEEIPQSVTVRDGKPVLTLELPPHGAAFYRFRVVSESD